MFKGRTRERAEILDPFGSYIVYGGRRLGKTALLRHIVSQPVPDAAFGFVDLFNVTSEADVFEKIANAFGSKVIKSSTPTGQEFGANIRQWLGSDERRRVLLLLDEADTFVRHEAETGFPCISAMLQLMAETKNRFKFVLAGLHNVSRAARAENSPLVQISNNPMRIGPLIDRDVADAEFLVRGPRPWATSSIDVRTFGAF
jgi:Cdc6-like AAA superfamily ATPase